MSSRHTLVLIVVAIVALMAAFWATSLRTPVTETGHLGPLFPGLGETINSVDALEIVAAGDEMIARLVKGESGWQASSHDGYPADSAKLRELLIDLVDANVMEQKTANPEFYSRLGVGDIADAEADGHLVRLGGLAEPLGLIVGETANTGGTYVRREGEAQSLLIDKELQLDGQPVDWLERQIVDIGSNRVQQVRIEHPDGEVVSISKSSREQTDFDVADVPAGRELSFPSSPNSIATALTALRLDDVRPADSVDLDAAGPVRVEYRLFDGTVLDLRGAQIDDERWLHIRVGFDDALARNYLPSAEADDDAGDTATSDAQTTDEATVSAADGDADEAAEPAVSGEDTIEAARAAAAALDQRLQKWVYAVPSYKYDQLTRRMEALLKSEDDQDAEQ